MVLIESLCMLLRVPKSNNFVVPKTTPLLSDILFPYIWYFLPRARVELHRHRWRDREERRAWALVRRTLRARHIISHLSIHKDKTATALRTVATVTPKAHITVSVTVSFLRT